MNVVTWDVGVPVRNGAVKNHHEGRLLTAGSALPMAGWRSLFDSILIIQDNVEVSKMEANSPIDLHAVLAAFEKKRAALDAAIAGVKVLLNDPEFAQVAVVGIGGVGAALSELSQGTEKTIILDDLDEHAFFGMSVAKAAQKYLSIKKKPASAQEIADAVEKGGFPVQSAQFGKTVTTTMYRGSDTFVKVKRGLWGLKTWYPNYRAPETKTS